MGYHCSVRRQQQWKGVVRSYCTPERQKRLHFFAPFFKLSQTYTYDMVLFFWMCHSWKPDGFIISRGLSVLVLYSVFKRGSFWRTSGVYFCEITRKLGLCLGLSVTSNRSKYNWFHGKNPVLTAIHADNSDSDSRSVFWYVFYT